MTQRRRPACALLFTLEGRGRDRRAYCMVHVGENKNASGTGESAAGRMTTQYTSEKGGCVVSAKPGMVPSARSSARVCVGLREKEKNGFLLALIFALAATLLELKRPLTARSRHKTALATTAGWSFSPPLMQTTGETQFEGDYSGKTGWPRGREPLQSSRRASAEG